MKLKKLGSLILCVTVMAGLGSCGTTDSDVSVVQAAIDAAETMTYEELVVKGKEEVGEGSMEVYGNSSALESALESFTASTGIGTTNNKLGDTDLYEKLTNTLANDTYVADMVLAQDGNKLQSTMLNNDLLLNYVPLDYVDVLDADDLDPTAAVYLNKTFMYNNTNFDGTNAETATAGALTDYLTNIWQLAGTDADAGHIDGPSFKTASQENINMNMLAMLTQDAWQEKLTSAYVSFYGSEPVVESKYENISYKWIGEFLDNCVYHTSDGTACTDLAAGLGGSVAYVNFNKQKALTETGIGNYDLANVTTPLIEEDGDVEGFGGFVYKMYTLIPMNAKYPYAAAALINYILSVDGFTNAWGTLKGYYSTNPNAPIADGDKSLSWWKSNTVIENPEYVASAYNDVYDFVTSYES